MSDNIYYVAEKGHRSVGWAWIPGRESVDGGVLGGFGGSGAGGGGDRRSWGILGRFGFSIAAGGGGSGCDDRGGGGGGRVFDTANGLEAEFEVEKFAGCGGA